MSFPPTVMPIRRALRALGLGTSLLAAPAAFAADEAATATLLAADEIKVVDGRVVPAEVPGNEVFTDGDPALGRRLYHEGIDAAGEPVAAVTKGDVQVSGSQFSCVNCHRPSGMGSSEGGNYVPPITAQHLFAERKLTRRLRNERFKEFYKESQPKSFWADVRQPRLRPAYTNESLARAVRAGIASSGRELASIMPRYELGERDVANLIAFLRTLSAQDDPGVDDETMHLATIVGADTDPVRREAFLATARAFVQWVNTDTQGQLRNPNFSPYYRSEFIDSFKHWKLHVWRLEGPPEGWPAQLREHYAAQPVFTVVSGLLRGPWAPVADFCDARRLPCVFPNTLLPRTRDAEDRYTLYFSRGLELEGEALATYLDRQGEEPGAVLQLHAQSAYGRVPAQAFARRAHAVLPGSEVETHGVRDVEQLEAAIAEAAGRADAIDTLVIWPGEHAAAAVAALNRHGSGFGRVVFAAQALDVAKVDLAAGLHDRVLFTFPYEKPSGYHPRAFRVRAWMRTRRLDIPDWRMQAQTYYAFSLIQFGLEHLLTDYHRDYLIEIIEHEAENELNPGTHPSLALGPGQRFASKGAFMVRLDADAPRGYRAVSDWIVP